jgi:hypothetical protein
MPIKTSIKSMFYDYITHDFFLGAAVAISLFIVIFMEIIRGKNVSRNQDGEAIIFMALATALSLGFLGIIEWPNFF